LGTPIACAMSRAPAPNSRAISRQNITFYLAEISYAWFNCKRQGCGKRKHMWAGPSSNGCQFAPKGWPCGYGGPTGTAPETLDSRGEA
jgi:hypothetical protein